MAAHTIIGVIFFVLFLLGMAALIYSGSRRGQPPRRPRWIAVGFGLEGFAFLFFGLTTHYFIAHSARPTAVGRVENLTRSTGKSPSSSFDIAEGSGHSRQVHTRYTGEAIHNGEQASVRFLDYDGAVLELSMLSGPTAGFVLREKDDSSGLFLGLLGLAFLIGAALSYRKSFGPGNNS